MKVLAPLAISLLLVSGCSSTPESKPEYDETEVIIWEKCMDTYLKFAEKYGPLDTVTRMDLAMLKCEDYKPAKR